MINHFAYTAPKGILASLFMGLSFFSFSCDESPDVNTLETSAQSIFGGETETGYPAVGTLVKKEFLGWKTTCTATLIKDNLLLTAAHCMNDFTPAQLKFAVGPTESSPNRYQIGEAIIHPRYYPNPIGSLYDIALLRLSEPVPSDVATPIAYRQDSIEPLLGESVLYVGYGATAGFGGGIGTKRRVNLPLSRIDGVTYSIDLMPDNEKGLCFGDSGGPGLVEVDGELQVIGVTSASYGCQGGTCGSCENGSKHTRVDRYADWIASFVGDSYYSCSSDAERCVCESACCDNGLCDNALCAQDTCGDILDCIFEFCKDSTDGGCANVCIENGHLDTREDLLTLVDCWGSKCRTVPGSDAERQCLIEKCGPQWAACNDQTNAADLEECGVTGGEGEVLEGEAEGDSEGEGDSESEGDSEGEGEDEATQSKTEGCMFQPAGQSKNRLMKFLLQLV